LTVSLEAKWQSRDLSLALEWAGDHPEFDDEFLISIKKQFDQRGYLTDKQYQALKNIMDKFNMEDTDD
jgi:hypothetical protein